MKRLLAGLIIAALFPISTLGQKLTVLSANEQSWSGGVAGYYGTNYSVMLKVTGGKIRVDSLYVKGVGFTTTTRLQGGVGVGKDTTERTYSIIAQESHDDGMHREPDFKVENNSNRPQRTYSGKALIVYEINGQKHLLAIKSIAKLQSLAYP